MANAGRPPQERSELAGRRLVEAMSIWGITRQKLSEDQEWREKVEVFGTRAIQDWRNNGVPENRITGIALFFGVNAAAFTSESVSDSEFKSEIRDSFLRKRQTSGNEGPIFCQLCGYSTLNTFTCQVCKTPSICTDYCYDWQKQQCIKCSSAIPMGNRTVEKFALLDNPDSEFEIRVWTEAVTTARFRDIGVVPDNEFSRHGTGEELRIHCQSSRDAYLWLFNIGPTGNLNLILPNAYRKQNKLLKDKVLSFPEPKDQFHWIIQGPSGVERIKAFGVLNEPEEFRHLTQQRGPFPERYVGVIEGIIRSLPPEQWAVASSTIVTG